MTVAVVLEMPVCVGRDKHIMLPAIPTKASTHASVSIGTGA